MSDTIAPIRVRDAVLADVPTIVEYNKLLALESENRRLNTQVLTEGVRQALERRELCRYFMAQIGGQVVGQTMLTYEWTDWRCGVLWWIQSVYVEHEFRRRGVFRALFDHIEALARSTEEVRGLRLYVEEHNAPAIATYRRMGMAPTGHFLLEMDWS